MTTFIAGAVYLSVRYDIFFDSDTQTIILQTMGSPVRTTVLPGALGWNEGDLIIGATGQQCIDNIYYQFYGSLTTPFVTFVPTPGGCTPPRVCDLVISAVAVTPETGIGLNNGTATGTVTTSNGPFNCTLDGLTYLPDNVVTFTNLPPATYAFSAKDAIGCLQSFIFTIQPYAAKYGCTDPAAANYDPTAQVNDGSCIYPDPADEALFLNNLYEEPDEFRLIYGDTTWQIDEPKDWDALAIVLKRDPLYHGVNYLFSEGDIKLRFDDDAGRQILLDAFAADGNDAVMRFQFGFDKFGDFIAEFDGYVDFNVFEIQENYVSAGVKRKTFSDLLETRAAVLTKLTNTISIPLHSKLIRKTTIVNTAASTGDITVATINKWNGGNDIGQPGYLAYFSYLDFSKATQNDLCTDAPLFGIYTDNPLVTGQHIFKTDGGGTFTFSIQFDISIHIKLEQAFVTIINPRHGYWSYRWYLVVNDFPNAFELPGGKTGFTNSRYNDIDFTTTYNKTLTLNQGDQVYLFGRYICEDRGDKKDALIRMDQVYQNLNISGDTLSLSTSAYAYLAFEAAQAVISEITEGAAKLKSNLLGRTDIGYESDGCAALMAYTNGYQIRGFNIGDRPIQIAFTDFIQGLAALYNVGMGYELNPLGNYIVRIELTDYFYQDVEIAFFDQVSDYLEDFDNTIVYNEMEFGYKKYTNTLPSSSNTLDEFCTVHDYLTPIVSYKNKLSQLCTQIASGYAIELTRRVQFADTPQDSWTYDEDNFVIRVVRTDGGFKSETNENYTASGIIGPDTAYNLALSPDRMLDRWGRWVNSGFAYKKPADLISNTYVANNGDLTSTLINPNGCDSTQTFTESQSITLGELRGFDKLFFPIKITFGKRISWNQFRDIKRCFQNQDTTGRNNGYFSVVDCSGNTQQGFLTELSYNPKTEYANFTLRKKFVDLNVPFDCSIYSSDDFAQFEATTGLPAEIEQCTFSNFA